MQVTLVINSAVHCHYFLPGRGYLSSFRPSLPLPGSHCLVNRGIMQGRNHVFKVGGPIPRSRLLYRTNYKWYTQFRALQSVT